jgi:hypothetical protein
LMNGRGKGGSNRRGGKEEGKEIKRRRNRV